MTWWIGNPALKTDPLLIIEIYYMNLKDSQIMTIYIHINYPQGIHGMGLKFTGQNNFNGGQHFQSITKFASIRKRIVGHPAAYHNQHALI